MFARPGHPSLSISFFLSVVLSFFLPIYLSIYPSIDLMPRRLIIILLVGLVFQRLNVLVRISMCTCVHNLKFFENDPKMRPKSSMRSG